MKFTLTTVVLASAAFVAAMPVANADANAVANRAKAGLRYGTRCGVPVSLQFFMK